MKWFGKFLQWIYCIYAFALFVALTLIAFPFVMFSLIFGKIRGGNIIYQICKYWAKIWYLLIGIRHKEVFEAPHDSNKQYIFVGNHISYIDIPAIVLIAHQSIRVLGKHEMVKIPIFGWIYRAAVILVDRQNPATRARSVRALKAAIKNNISIFIFPEGTFNETKKPLKSFFDGAFRIAVETQTNIKPILLVDTIDRLHYHSLFSLTPGKNRVVYLEEVSVQGLSTSDIHLLKERVHQQMEAGLRRYRTYSH
ncbi:MAG: 1-acyl-sn-glycerol-3-phosphate acyltransferase [Chitinophagaceae bacterium]|nr:1-acyl-sn-glycerol-3-phosphate acyltransferase [Chitinophagaceae bacterium]